MDPSWAQFGLVAPGAAALLYIAAKFLMRQGAGYQQLLGDQREAYEARIAGAADDLRRKDEQCEEDRKYYRTLLARLNDRIAALEDELDKARAELEEMRRQP